MEHFDFVDTQEFTAALPHSLEYAEIQNGELYKVLMKLKGVEDHEAISMHAMVYKLMGSKAIALADGGWSPQVGLFLCDADMQPARQMYASVTNRQFTLRPAPFTFARPQPGQATSGIIISEQHDPDPVALSHRIFFNQSGDTAHDTAE